MLMLPKLQNKEVNYYQNNNSKSSKEAENIAFS